VPGPSELERQLEALAVELHKLESEYTMYFAARSSRPPIESRARVEAAIRRLDRAGFDSATLRFRFGNLQARYTALADLWDRGLRAKEEGRHGPFAWPRHSAVPSEATDHPTRSVHHEPETGGTPRVVGIVALSEPLAESAKLRQLYDLLADTRRELGEPAVPFHRFAELVRDQVGHFQHAGAAQVAFRVSVKEGRVNLTARALRGEKR
jgi:hypothetical protein